MTLSKRFLVIGAGYGFLAVVLDALGTHGLKQLGPGLLVIWHLAAQYQFWHALALLAVGILARSQALEALKASGWCFALGTLIFSGSLYALVLSGVGVVSALVPVGGLLLLAGWGALLYAAIKLPAETPAGR